jgi:hypothetical protein
MEPRALANINGTLHLAAPPMTPRAVSYQHTVSPTKEFLTMADTPSTSLKIDRRASTLWERSPRSDTDANAGEENREFGDDTLILSPVPKTPGPEQVSAYAEGLLDTPGDDSMTPYFMKQKDLIQMTAPPKQNGNGKGYGELGFGGVETDEEAGRGILMQRLMAARRKSLQWAPKIGSPLAR